MVPKVRTAVFDNNFKQSNQSLYTALKLITIITFLEQCAFVLIKSRQLFNTFCIRHECAKTINCNIYLQHP